MKGQTLLHLMAGAVLLLLAGLLGHDVYQGYLSNQPAKALELWGKVLVAILAAIGGLYVLTSSQEHQREIVALQHSIQRDQSADAAGIAVNLELLKGSITQLNNSISSEQALRSTVAAEIAKRYIAEEFEPRIKQFEAVAAAKKKYVELAYEDDFRRRERRDQALMGLSRAVLRTTRAFRTLSKFRLGDGTPSEALVNILAQALAAREAFLSAREELVVLHAVAPEHERLLRAYSTELIDMIIDVRRPSARDSVTSSDYERIMTGHEANLDHLDEKLGELLAVFLAPHQREPTLLDGKGRSEVAA
ncbi:hypothetical protein [Ideonella sp. YS5]|uniref:hypothetical protein n=1 Tax=Ideonella sp. YS5 TaxID=3453714 RepID=UPI003EEFD5E9